MHLLLPILPYLLIVAMTIVLLGLFYGINQTVYRLRKQVAQCEASVTARGSEFANGLMELKRSMADWGAAGDGQAVSQAVRVAGLNTSLRGKVLKMHRLGQSPDRIAEALRVPKGEVDLLVKVHRVVMRPYAEVPCSDHDK
jgi:hypothetical protein